MNWLAAIPFLTAAVIQLANSFSGSLVGLLTKRTLDNILTQGLPGQKSFGSAVTFADLVVEDHRDEVVLSNSPHHVRAIVTRDRDASTALVSVLATLVPGIPLLVESAYVWLLVAASFMASLATSYFILKSDPEEYKASSIGPISRLSATLCAVNVILALLAAAFVTPPAAVPPPP